MSLNESILEVLQLSSVALKAGEIAEKSGIDKKEVEKVIKKLIAEGIIVSPKRCYYQFKA